MSNRQPLTELAHQGWLPFLREGGWAIDATAGNGFDTAFLADKVGPDGKVYAIDVQSCALEATRRRLEQAGQLRQVSLIQTDHARMRDCLACGAWANVDLICFNLGYLPNGDHEVITSPGSTLLALHEALLLLKPEGALSVIAYRGHPGALEEATAVERFFLNLPKPWRCLEHLETGTPDNPGPVWWLASAKDA